MIRAFLQRAAGLLVAISVLAAIFAPAQTTTTPIQYIVVIFQENNSFDHYFATYPGCPSYPSGQPVNATYPAGESAFTPLP